MILEKGKNNILEITRLIRRSDDYANFDSSPVDFVFIKQFESIDYDKWIIKIVINSNILYSITLIDKSKHPDFINDLIKTEVRDQKLNTILS